MRWLTKLLVAGMAIAGPASAAIVDISATATGPTVLLAAGRYTMAFVGTADGGAYNAYSLWSHPFPWNDPRSNPLCLSGQSQCRYGYQSRFVATIDGAATHFGLAADLTPPQPGYYRFMTELAAITAAKAGPYAAPLEFTLASATTVRFDVEDSSLGDNEGGVSIMLTAVPEPAEWALLAGGFAIVGAGARQRRIAPTSA